MTDDDAVRMSRLIVELRRLQRRPAPETPADGAADGRGTAPAPKLSMSGKEVLGYVHEHPGAGTSAIAEALRLAPNTVSGIVSALVRDGYLERTPDERDRRAARLRLTPEAAARRSARWGRRAGTVGRAFELLDDGDRAALRAALPALEALRDAMAELRGSELGPGRGGE
ncbi:MarR family winged helix-turn-helix transcriptional regulator [Corynebacterium sp. 335C]